MKIRRLKILKQRYKNNLNSNSRSPVFLRLSFILLGLTPILAVTALAVNTWTREEHQAQNQLGAETTLAAAITSNFLDRYESGLTLFGREISEAPGLFDSQIKRMELMKAFAAAFGSHTTLNLRAPNGEVLASTSPLIRRSGGLLDDRIIDDDLTKAVSAKGMTLGTPLLGPILNRWVLPLRLALHSRSGKLLGFVSAPITLSHVLSTLQRIQAVNTQRFPGEAVLIMNKVGVVLARSPKYNEKYALLFMHPFHGALVRAIRTAPQRQIAGNFHGRIGPRKIKRFVRWQRVADGGIIISISIPTNDIRAQWIRLLWPIFAGIILYLASLTIVYNSILYSVRRRNALARTDALTGLSNRRGLIEYMEYCLQDKALCRGFTLIVMFDLDGFKQINDTYGHAAGDILLCDLGGRLQTAARPQDFIARLGGDEFIMVVKGLAHIDDVEPILKRIIAAVQATVTLQSGIIVNLNTSCGAAIYPRDGVTIDRLLDCADQALYTSKRSKTVRQHEWSIYDPEQDAALRRSHILMLLRNNGLHIHYQPIIDLGSGSVVELEALARLSNKSGLLLPHEFLPFLTPADRLELAIAMLNGSIRDLITWSTLGFGGFGVAINVDPDVLAQQEFISALQHGIKTQGITPSQITIEILEGGNFANAEIGRVTVAQLHSMGVRISLDDVGNGYSSLARMKDLTVHQVKLDQSFVRGLIANPKNVSFILALQIIAKALNTQMVVEGVEDLQILSGLEALGVECAQGYLFALPMEADNVTKWFFDQILVNTKGFNKIISVLPLSGLNSNNYHQPPGDWNTEPTFFQNLNMPQTLFGAFVSHLLNRAVFSLNPPVLGRISDIGDSKICQLGQYIDYHKMGDSELGKAHDLYHSLLGLGQFRTPEFYIVSKRLEDIIVGLLRDDKKLDFLEPTY